MLLNSWPTNPFCAAIWYCGTAPAVSLTVGCQRGQRHPALYLYTRSGKKQVCTYIPKALHETVRQWVDNGRRVKRLVDQVSQQHLQHLWEQKQSLFRGKSHSPAEDHSP